MILKFIFRKSLLCRLRLNFNLQFYHRFFSVSDKHLIHLLYAFTINVPWTESANLRWPIMKNSSFIERFNGVHSDEFSVRIDCYNRPKIL